MYDIKPVVGNCVIILCLLCNVYVENHHVYLLNHIFLKILFTAACLSLSEIFSSFYFCSNFLRRFLLHACVSNFSLFLVEISAQSTYRLPQIGLQTHVQQAAMCLEGGVATQNMCFILDNDINKYDVTSALYAPSITLCITLITLMSRCHRFIIFPGFWSSCFY